MITLATYKMSSKNSDYKLKALNVSVWRMEIDEGSDVVIPCKTTQPFVNVSFSYRTLIKELLPSDHLTDENLLDDIQLYVRIFKTHLGVKQRLPFFDFHSRAGIQRIRNLSTTTLADCP